MTNISNVLLKLALDHLFISSSPERKLSALREIIWDKSRYIYWVQRTSEKGESPVAAARRSCLLSRKMEEQRHRKLFRDRDASRGMVICEQRTGEGQDIFFGNPFLPEVACLLFFVCSDMEFLGGIFPRVEEIRARRNRGFARTNLDGN